MYMFLWGAGTVWAVGAALEHKRQTGTLRWSSGWELQEATMWPRRAWTNIWASVKEYAIEVRDVP